jgi:hypothetical protein
MAAPYFMFSHFVCTIYDVPNVRDGVKALFAHLRAEQEQTGVWNVVLANQISIHDLNL